MKTEVVMKRELWGGTVSQKSKSGMLKASDLVKNGNRFRKMENHPLFDLHAFLKTKSTREFIFELEKKYGANNVLKIVKGRGKTGTWVHPLLFIDIALSISPKLKIEVYDWLFDHLLEVRNDSGDSYRQMAGALWQNCKSRSNFSKSMIIVANMIKDHCNVHDWQTATVEQLAYRNKIHANITLLCDVLTDNNQAVRLGIEKTKRIQQATENTGN